MNQKQEDTIDLLKLFKVLLNKLWLLIIVAVLFAVVSYSVTKTMIKPEYEATSKLYVFNKSDFGSSGAVSSSDISTSKVLVNTYIVVLQSDSVLGQVVDTISEYQGKEGFEYLGTEPYTTKQLRGMISAGSINNTESFSVTVTANDPYEAKFINDAILYFLPDEIIRVVKAGAVEIIDKASIPTAPSSPSVMKNTVLGGFVGGVLTAAIIVVMALFDNVIHTEEDLTSEFPDISVVGVIPDYKVEKQKAHGEATQLVSHREKQEQTKPKKKIELNDDDFENED
ncbi:MAG: YveK family protein [Candidatus Ornithospirochaeta sp.]